MAWCWHRWDTKKERDFKYEAVLFQQCDKCHKKRRKYLSKVCFYEGNDYSKKGWSDPVVANGT